MTELELSIVSELMKDSRISNRELSRKVGASLYTVTRALARLKMDGVVQEYTAIPNFLKFGFTIFAVTFVKLERFLTAEEIDQAKALIRDTLKVMCLPVVMLERGTGIDSDGVIISYHEDFTSHTKFLDLLRGTGFLNVNEIKSFRVDLRDKVSFVPLTFSLMADYISAMGKAKGSQ